MICFKRLGFYLSLVVGFHLSAYTQHQNLVGLNVNTAVDINEFRPSVGFTFEKQFTKHTGVETGLFYRTQRVSGFIIYDAWGTSPYFFVVSQRHLSVPVLYKYYSKIINFSAGPALDFYVGWKQKNNASTRISAYNVHPKVAVGLLIKLSRTIPLRKQWIVEPELRYSSVQHLGMGIAGKYRL